MIKISSTRSQPRTSLYRLSVQVISCTALTMDDGYGGLAGARNDFILGGSGGGTGSDDFGGRGGTADRWDNVDDVVRDDLDDAKELLDWAMALAISSWVGGGGKGSSSSSSKGSASSESSSMVE